jgi:CopY/TcrY family copper transport repressor
MTTAEWEIMRIIWTLGDIGSGEVITAIQKKRDWTESTIKTLLRRLVKKGMLTTKAEGRKFIYHPTVAEKDAMEQTSTDLFAHMCAMKKGAVINNLIAATELSQDDIRSMQAMLASKLATAPKTVACDCLGSDDDCCAM